MALHLYRRHRRDCTGGHTEDSRSGDFEERRKGWRQCECLIYVSGTPAGKFSRQPNEKTTWEDARAFVRAPISDLATQLNGALSSHHL
jgi:hypothetical protein